MCISKCYNIIVSYIHIIYISSHPGNFVPLVVQHRDICHFLRLYQVKQIKAFVIAGSSSVPIACSLITAPIIRITVYESLHAAFYLLHSLLHPYFIALIEIQTSQPIRANPRIPVHAGRLPPVFTSQDRFQHSVVYLLAYLCRQCGTHLCQGTLQSAACPSQQCCRLCIKEVYCLLIIIWNCFAVVSRNTPPGLSHHRVDTHYYLIDETALSLYYLRHSKSC